MNYAAPVIVARTWTDAEAAVIKSLLESYDIPCHYSSEIPHRIYPVSVDGLGEIRIFVPAPLMEEATRILEEHRRRQAPLRLVEDEEGDEVEPERTRS
jgi:hypothetical protein